MQGQRSSVGSLSETINFEHGSSSNNSGNQPVYWNNMWNPAENRIPDYLLPTSDINTGYVSSVSHEQRGLSRWSLGEPSSCDMQTEALPDEQKAELVGWSSVTRDADGPVTENRLCEPSNNPSLGHVNLSPLIIQNSNSNVIPHNLNLNASFASHGGDNSRVNEGSNVYKSSGSEEGRMLCSSASDPLLLPSGNSGLPVVANDGRAGSSLDGRRAPCKRKSIEGSVAQSSLSGSSNYSQHIESGAEPSLSIFPGRYNTGSRLSIPAPPARMNQAPIRGAGELTSNSFSESIVAESSESSQRNYRIRISSSNAQDSFASTGTTVRHPGASSSQLPARLLPAEHVLDLRPAPAVDNLSAQGQPIMIHVPALPRSLQPYRWNGSSTSRSGGSSSSAGERQVVQREEVVRPSNMGRNVSEHPMFVPANELRNLVRNPSTRGLTSSNLSIPGNVASTSRVGSSSGVVHPSSGPWMPPENSPTQFPRRLTEYVRRQLFSSAANESGARTSNYSQRSGSTSAPDMVLSSGSGRRGHHLLQPRSALWMERRGDSGLGLPYSLRTLATSSEGSDNNRLVSEQIRNVLGLVRRGESLRVEDVMILDQSLFFGMADIYDRHRDMRLDVDNMSYEELLALEERIGNVNTGLNEETIVSRLKQRKHVNAVESQVEEEPCCVCQEEYMEGEDIGMLECGHGFHTRCIKQWLMQKNLCPICKTTGLGSRE